MIRKKKHDQSFQDGIVMIYDVVNTAPPGGLPNNKLAAEPKKSLRYDEKTVGIQRFEAAMQNNAKIETLLRCPRARDVSTQDIAVPIDGKQYNIRQIQYPEDIHPPVMDLSLVRVEQVYEFA